jgi:hypothetical protein
LKLQLEQLEDRLVPTVLTAHGGPVIANPNLVDVFLQSPQPAMDQLAPVLVGPYAQMLAPYGIQTGSFAGSATLSFPQSVVFNADIQSALASNILAGKLPPPGPNQVYLVYLAPGQTFGDSWAQFDSGYHSAFMLNGQWVYYGVVLAQNNSSVPASHEFADTITDPQPGTGWFGVNTNQEEADPQNGNFFNLDGFNVTLITLPNGQVLPSTPSLGQPTFSNNLQAAQAVSSLLTERLFADFWGLLALLDPALFAGQAQQAQAAVAANPALNTSVGQQDVALADQFFAMWMGQL